MMRPEDAKLIVALLAGVLLYAGAPSVGHARRYGESGLGTTVNVVVVPFNSQEARGE